MSVIASLKAVAEAFPQARVVAFADLSSRMVLCSAGSADLTQEHLDRLCREAITSFADPLSALAVEAFGTPHRAIVIVPDAVKLFLRSDSGGPDALCCVCDHGIDLGPFITRLQATLDEISAIS